jgi:hypothetical protein
MPSSWISTGYTLILMTDSVASEGLGPLLSRPHRVLSNTLLDITSVALFVSLNQDDHKMV